MKRFLLLLITCLALNHAQSQQIFNEDFNDSAGSLLSSIGWTQIDANVTNPIQISDVGLSTSNYVLSGVGNKILLNTSGQDVYQDVKLSRSSGNLYTAFMLQVSSAGTGDYLMGLLPPTSTSAFTGRVFIKAASAGYYKIGISKGSTAQANIETASYSTDSFSYNSTQLFVLKYTFISGLANDSIFLFALPNGMSLEEPLRATIATKGGSNTDPVSLGRIFLRQGTAGSSALAYLDGIRMSLTWNDLTTATIQSPKPVSGISMNSTSPNSLKIQWTKETDYIDSNMSTLVFLKKTSGIDEGVPTNHPNSYTSDTDFTKFSSVYQNDQWAKCVYKGDLNSISVNGLSASSYYYLLVYIVRDIDSTYSIGKKGGVSTPSTTPSSIIALNFTSNVQNGAKLNWYKSTNYNNDNHTILIFMKSGSAVSQGIYRTMNPNKITADSNFSGHGTKFQNDTNARCVYKGDGNSVQISGLAISTNYHLLSYVVNDADSVYSSGTRASGLSGSAGPLSVIIPKIKSIENGKLNISWTANTDYSISDYTTLVYLKNGSIINHDTTKINPASVTADSTFTNGSLLKSDTNAMCVYKGHNLSINVNNLIPTNTYYATIYVVRNSDSSCSNPTTANGTVRSLPVSNITVKGLNSSTINISWTKPVGYNNSGYSTLVFIKKDKPINIGTPTWPIVKYTSSNTFGLGSIYQNDTEAFCVQKADLTRLNISGLSNQFLYHVLIFIVRDADSTYSESAIASGSSSIGVPRHYYINEVNKVNSISGEPDSLYVRATLRGIVYGPNQSTNGLKLTIRDETGGIVIMSPNKTFSYIPKEGDSIEAQGSIAVASGLTQLSTLDTIFLIASSKTLKKAILKEEKLDETNESDLVKYYRVSFYFNTSGNWAPNSTEYCHINNSNDLVELKILSNSPLRGKPMPTTSTFNVTGIVTQVSSSSSAPFPFDGYQLILRDSNDIQEYPDTLGAFSLDLPYNGIILNLAEDSNQIIQFNWTRSKPLIGPVAANYKIHFDLPNGNFQLPLYSVSSFNNGADTFARFKYKELADSLGLKPNDTINLNWSVSATSQGSLRWANQKWNLTCLRGLFTGLSKTIQENQIEIYPNPSKGILNINSSLPLQTVEVYDQKGCFIQTLQINSPNPINQIPAGLYILKLKTDDAVFYRKFIKE